MITDSERASIVQEVLEAVRTNSVTIEQLMPTMSVDGEDYIEISGGRRISFYDFRNFVANLSNTDKEELEEADRELLRQLTAEIANRQAGDAAIEAKADTAIQLGNTANAANSRQDGEIATLQDSVKGLSIDLDFLQGMVDDIPVVLLPFKSQVYAPQEIKDSSVYFCVKESAFMTLRSDNTVGKVEAPYNSGEHANESGLYLFYQISNKKIYSVIATDERTRRLTEYCAETMQDTVTGIRTSITELAETVERGSIRYFHSIVTEESEIDSLVAGNIFFYGSRFCERTEDGYEVYEEYNNEIPVSPGHVGKPGVYILIKGGNNDVYICNTTHILKNGRHRYAAKLINVEAVLADEATDEDVDTAADEVFGAIETETT